MSKRFTDTNKWADEWFSELDADMKLVWFYLVDNCSHAGIWKRSIKLLKYHTGTTKSQIEIENILADRIYKFEDKWLIPKFLKFQYSQGLNSNKPVIISVKKELIDHDLMLIITERLGNDYLMVQQSLDNGSLTIKDKDKDKDKDKEYITIKEEQGQIFFKIKHLEITKGEYNKLLTTGYNSDQIETIFEAIENYAKIEKYTSLYLTANKWLKKEFPEVTQKKSEAKITPIYSFEPELATRKVKPAF